MAWVEGIVDPQAAQKVRSLWMHYSVVSSKALGSLA
jgi:hypothetical protein